MRILEMCHIHVYAYVHIHNHIDLVLTKLAEFTMTMTMTMMMTSRTTTSQIMTPGPKPETPCCIGSSHVISPFARRADWARVHMKRSGPFAGGFRVELQGLRVSDMHLFGRGLGKLLA